MQAVTVHPQETAESLALKKNHRHCLNYLDRQSGNLQANCRAALRTFMTPRRIKHVCVTCITASYLQIDALPLPVELKLFVNYSLPYPGFTVDARPQPRWTLEDVENGNFPTCLLFFLFLFFIPFPVDMLFFLRAYASYEVLVRHNIHLIVEYAAGSY
jgi:hypothetical protein